MTLLEKIKGMFKFLDIHGLKYFFDGLRRRGVRYIFEGTQEEWDALTTAQQNHYEIAHISGHDDRTYGAVTDVVKKDDMRAVTSNAVFMERARGMVPDGVSIDDMVGPEWVGTWYVSASVSGHKPYVAGGIFAGNAVLRISCPFANSANTIQEFVDDAEAIKWKATRIYRDGWLNASDTVMVNTYYGGWAVTYDSPRYSWGGTTSYNGINVYVTVNPGNTISLHLVGCDKSIETNIRYLFIHMNELLDYLWRGSLPTSCVSAFMWAVIPLMGGLVGGVVPTEDGDGRNYCILIPYTVTQQIWGIGELNINIPISFIN